MGIESTTWSSIAVGPPLGGAAIGLFGPVITVVADALSYLLSALGITAIGGRDEAPQRTGKGPVRGGASYSTVGGTCFPIPSFERSISTTCSSPG